MSTNFIHLNCHSEYSLVDGLLRIKPWLTQAASQGMPAIALTDHTNLFGMVKFYKESLTLGIKPIIGCDVWIENELHPNQPSKLLLLCHKFNQSYLAKLYQWAAKWHPYYKKNFCTQFKCRAVGVSAT